MKNKYKGKRVLVIILIVLTLAMILYGLYCHFESDKDGEKPREDFTVITKETESKDLVDNTAVNEIVLQGAEFIESQDIPIAIGHDLYIKKIGSYTGAFIEDGSDVQVQEVCMIILTNKSDKDLQYANINLTIGSKEGNFKVTTLTAGASALVLETKGIPYTKDIDYSSVVLDTAVFFSDELSLCEDTLEITALDRMLNVKNLSSKDINEDIFIYYKTIDNGIYMGGITYRVRVSGGLKAGEIKQVAASHYNKIKSSILFVTYGQ